MFSFKRCTQSLALLYILLLGLVVAAPTLRITQDNNAKCRPEPFLVWSSKVTYKSPTNRTLISDSNLYALAKQAYEEMAASWEKKSWPSSKPKGPLPLSQRPGVMTAMTVGKAVYFSSSIKGEPYMAEGGTGLSKNGHSFIYDFTNPKDDAALALNQCQLGLAEHRVDTDVKAEHRTRASCGEPMVYLQWKRDKAAEIPGPEGIRIATYGRPGGKKDPAGMPPCSTPDPKDDSMHLGGPSWGCHEFLLAHGITAAKIPDKKILSRPKPDIPSVRATQIMIC